MIVTSRADRHADLVSERIAQKGGSSFRLDLDAFPRHFALDLEFVAGAWSGELVHQPSGQALAISDIAAVWTRKSAGFAFLDDDLAPQERAYAGDETEHILLGLLYSLDCYWMSHPRALRSANWKGEQLLRAARMGFTVPRSLITNQPGSVRRFRETVANEMVFKSLSSPFLGADSVADADRIATGIATTHITDEHDDLLAAVEQLPSFFQAYIPKQYELRVTVIGEKVFAARIHSQDDERTRTDYRDYSAEIRYEAAELPAEIERRCAEFVHSYGLTFGAIDLIVTPDGEYLFLENNPAGQFLFIEQLVPELTMIDAVADRLIEGARSRGLR